MKNEVDLFVYQILRFIDSQDLKPDSLNLTVAFPWDDLKKYNNSDSNQLEEFHNPINGEPAIATWNEQGSFNGCEWSVYKNFTYKNIQLDSSIRYELSDNILIPLYQIVSNFFPTFYFFEVDIILNKDEFRKHFSNFSSEKSSEIASISKYYKDDLGKVTRVTFMMAIDMNNLPLPDS